MSPSMTNSMWVTLLRFFVNSLLNYVSSHDQQTVNDTTLFFCQAVSSIMSHPMTNRQWAVTLLYFFARQSHQSCLIPWPTGSEWHCFISFMPGQSHQSCLIQWPTGSEWCYFISFPGTLINHVSFPWPTGSEWCCFISLPGSLIYHVQQEVSDTALFLSQTLSSIPWPTVCEWYSFIPLPSSLINHVSSLGQQYVSDITAYFLARQPHQSHGQQKVSGTTLCLCQAVSWSHQSCLIPWPTGSEWHYFISLPASLIIHVSCHGQ